MSRDAYIDIGGRATQDAKAEDTTAGMQEVAKQDAYRDVGGRECLEQILEPKPRKSVATSIQ